jgi:hypothetical protein
MAQFSQAELVFRLVGPFFLAVISIAISEQNHTPQEFRKIAVKVMQISLVFWIEDFYYGTRDSCVENP